jgi:hypothetical protein
VAMNKLKKSNQTINATKGLFALFKEDSNGHKMEQKMKSIRENLFDDLTIKLTAQIAPLLGKLLDGQFDFKTNWYVNPATEEQKNYWI